MDMPGEIFEARRAALNDAQEAERYTNLPLA